MVSFTKDETAKNKTLTTEYDSGFENLASAGPKFKIHKLYIELYHVMQLHVVIPIEHTLKGEDYYSRYWFTLKIRGFSV